MTLHKPSTYIIFSLLSLILIALPDLAFAQSTAPAENNFVNFINKIVNLLTGTIGTSLAVLAVAIMGLLAMFGIFNTQKAMITIFGIVLLFSAAWVVKQIAPDSNSTSSLTTQAINRNHV